MGLDANLKRYLPVIICLMIAAIAYFQATGIGQLIAAVALDGAEPARSALPPVSHRHALQRDPDHETSAAAILERNPFDSVTGPLHEAPVTGPESPEVALTDKDPYEDPPCAGARALLIASSDDPAWSFAVIEGADGKSMMRRQGEEVDGQKIFFVGDLRNEENSHVGERGVWDRVWLTSNTGARCQLALGAKPVGVKPKTAAVSSAVTAAPGAPWAGKIRQTGETQFEIDRSAVEATIANPAELMKARIFPVKDGDRVTGMRLMGVRPGTLLGALGMQNGDVLTSINGFEMNDPQKMLEAYTKLMKADRLTATVTRGGRPVNLEFSIK